MAAPSRLDSSDVEILRDDLTALVTAATDAEYLYGDSIAGLAQDEQGVDVTFESGGRRRYDFVVGADGLHSNIRDLVFGGESRFLRHLGMYVAIVTAPNFLDLDHWQIWHREGDAGFGLFSDRDPSVMRVNLGFAAGPIDYDHRDLDQQRRLIQERCSELRWEAPRLIEAMGKADDFFFDAMAQVEME